MAVVVSGFKGLEKKLGKLADIQRFFHPVVEDVATDMLNDLMDTTPYDDLGPGPHTVNMWELNELATATFSVDNTKVSEDGKHAIAGILNDGRDEVVPVRAKKLYIPISRKGKRKKWGEPIPKDSKFGVDFVLADKSKAVEPTNFITDAEKQAQKNLEKGIAANIRKEFQ